MSPGILCQNVLWYLNPFCSAVFQHLFIMGALLNPLQHFDWERSICFASHLVEIWSWLAVAAGLGHHRLFCNYVLISLRKFRNRLLLHLLSSGGVWMDDDTASFSGFRSLGASIKQVAENFIMK